MPNNANYSPPLFIAEVSSNHSCNLERCYEFIDTAARIGCGAVKFQLFKIKELFAPDILAQSAEHCNRKRWELPEDFVPLIADRCREHGILFSCTPFYLDAVDILTPHVDFFKIASYELLWTDLLKKCASSGKPVVLSTGMADMNEIEEAVLTLHEAGCVDLTLLHCVSGYPAPVEQANLAAMQTMKDKFNCKIGWSDHTVSEAVIQRAIHRYDAQMIELHLDLDEAGEEYRFGHCWLPDQVKRMIKSIQNGFAADGDGIKKPVEAELPDREWRADPVDGLRPLKSIRKKWKAD
ncbi:N-acetylneuraminate synthase family protein [Maridesulfovibrio salexigens]|uniref:N-acetylneuraminic acid synthase domain protein n=1 Tax=Maridesulfovibrio salexigens (strain ATCC 14822 / DSM 2638 / NCIMB 8403 / VKM B-1763) TaxID=526222 RepID=C6BXS4_MARSD|nr:N-acetylneuraminate synthase family protein [Maridesulfovibrio salexigens]ACS78632.1 N-acetylneuraminic acid synthase domain protein [Maridesulfovibrio salexigens DSM 2638]